MTAASSHEVTRLLADWGEGYECYREVMRRRFNTWEEVNRIEP